MHPNNKYAEAVEHFRNTGLKHHKFKSRDYSIIITTQLFPADIFNLLFIFGSAIVLLLNTATLILSFFVLAAGFYFSYKNLIGLNIVCLDFDKKILMVNHRLFIFRFSRKLFGTKTTIKFEDILGLGCREGTLLDQLSGGGYATRYYLLIKTERDPEIIISQFRKETESRAFQNLLEKMVKPEQKIKP
jgi:hypothetical protein